VNGEAPATAAHAVGERAEVDVEELAIDAVAPPAEGDGAAGDGGERDGRRRGRGGRDRPRRERRDEAPTSGVEAVSEAAVVELPPVDAAAIDTTTVMMTAADGGGAAAAPNTTTPLVAEAEIATVQAFVLPTDELNAVAESAGLQWVGSDVDKVRAVQEAMASEPKPAHVPREPKPVVAVDEGPLVLVETRKDLAQIKLPFETAQGSQPAA
jgi:ribonuclease E